MKIKETDLFSPLKCYLEQQGYSVHSEVHNCDIVARRGDELVIVELKTRFNMALLAQAVKRKQLTESVYVAVALPQGKNHLPNFSHVKMILRRLEVGLIIINFLKTKIKVQVMFHPREYTRKTRHKRKMAVIREIDGRYAEFDTGGSPAKGERITAYKQESIRVAYILNKKGSLAPRELHRLGTGVKTQGILSHNVYGWFDRVKRGTYALNESGELALKKYKEIIKKIQTNWHGIK